MKRFGLSYKLILASIVVLFMITLTWAEKPTLVIMDFEANGIPPEEAKVFTEHLKVELFNSESYSIIEKSEINQKLQEEGFSGDKCATVDCLVQAGKFCGAEQAVGGSITKIGDTYSVMVRLVDVNHSQLVKAFAYDHKGDIISLLSDGTSKVAAKISEPKKLNAEPVVAEKVGTVVEDTVIIAPARGKGGIVPALASCMIGPRVGLEMNEGNDTIYQSEWIALGGSVVGSALTGYFAPLGSAISVGTRAYMAYDMGGKSNGLEGALASYCLGPRVGNELHYRKIRTLEWLQLVPCVCIYPMIALPLEAYKGKTMTEIEIEEGLRK